MYRFLSWAAEHTPAECSSALSFINTDFSVYEDVLDADGILIGDSKVARSMTFAGSKMVMSANMPSLINPRSFKPTRAAGAPVIL